MVIAGLGVSIVLVTSFILTIFLLPVRYGDRSSLSISIIIHVEGRLRTHLIACSAPIFVFVIASAVPASLVAVMLVVSRVVFIIVGRRV
jgi:hypothetical protein